jgi:hypothetical protein
MSLIPLGYTTVDDYNGNPIVIREKFKKQLLIFLCQDYVISNINTEYLISLPNVELSKYHFVEDKDYGIIDETIVETLSKSCDIPKEYNLTVYTIDHKTYYIIDGLYEYKAYQRCFDSNIIANIYVYQYPDKSKLYDRIHIKKPYEFYI